MPYIESGQRKWFDDDLQRLGAKLARVATAGDLNYILTKIILAYLGNEPHYLEFNAAVGILECVKQELYRRRVAPYEDEKIKENGDAY